METLDLVNLVFRWMHILAAIVAVGGTFFVRFVLLPAEGVVPRAERAALHAAMRARWSKIVAAAILFLLVSGLYNIYFIEAKTTAPRVYDWYRPLFGLKFLLAFVIFTIASLLTGKTKAAERLRENARFWLSVNVALAVVVVLISGVLRTADKKPRSEESTKSAAAESRTNLVFKR